jgi:hypothetical protein
MTRRVPCGSADEAAVRVIVGRLAERRKRNAAAERPASRPMTERAAERDLDGSAPFAANIRAGQLASLRQREAAWRPRATDRGGVDS